MNTFATMLQNNKFLSNSAEQQQNRTNLLTGGIRLIKPQNRYQPLSERLSSLYHLGNADDLVQKLQKQKLNPQIQDELQQSELEQKKQYTNQLQSKLFSQFNAPQEQILPEQQEVYQDEQQESENYFQSEIQIPVKASSIRFKAPTFQQSIGSQQQQQVQVAPLQKQQSAQQEEDTFEVTESVVQKHVKPKTVVRNQLPKQPQQQQQPEPVKQSIQQTEESDDLCLTQTSAFVKTTKIPQKQIKPTNKITKTDLKQVIQEPQIIQSVQIDKIKINSPKMNKQKQIKVESDEEQEIAVVTQSKSIKPKPKKQTEYKPQKQIESDFEEEEEEQYNSFKKKTTVKEQKSMSTYIADENDYTVGNKIQRVQSPLKRAKEEIRGVRIPDSDDEDDMPVQRQPQYNQFNKNGRNEVKKQTNISKREQDILDFLGK
ncbi:Hypothetical_protein [Hexamita inflata]|uniref:Hypothetical_protein n=1 Tax=Hexamita inflata TaxID=28002 RepID=A0AA86R059_9EUKA|nr:Hypothetical protein HINF_LOCUS54207 [Hexamita inflata]